MDVVEFRAGDGDLLASLRRIDTSFTTSTVLAVHVREGGVAWAERELVVPFTKRYPVLDGGLPEGATAFAAVDGGVAVGYAATEFHAWNRRQVLTDLLVDARTRRQGVARTLVERVRSVGVRNGARELWLETQDVNLPAIRAYRALGFTITGCDVTLYDRPHDTEAAVFLTLPLEAQGTRGPARAASAHA